ncbi:MAG: CrcB family protein [Nitriliruptorales bacterium]|nr:CrcB family protein [Nitriliruptorales bacterium]
MTWQRWLAVFIGSAVGTGLRVAVSLLNAGPGGWPWGTFAVNLTGAFLLGYLLARLQGRRPPRTRLLAFLGTGLLGSYTTFSAFAEESRALLADAEVVLALAYVLTSLVLGVALAWAGIRAARLRP